MKNTDMYQSPLFGLDEFEEATEPPSYVFQRGQVWYWEDPVYGSHQARKGTVPIGECTQRYSRYVIIMQEPSTSSGNTLMVVPCTSHGSDVYDIPVPIINKQRSRFHGYARLHLAFPVSVRTLTSYIMTLDDRVMNVIDSAYAKIMTPWVASEAYNVSTSAINKKIIDRIDAYDFTSIRSALSKADAEAFHQYATECLVMDPIKTNPITLQMLVLGFNKWRELHDMTPIFDTMIVADGITAETVFRDHGSVTWYPSGPHRPWNIARIYGIKITNMPMHAGNAAAVELPSRATIVTHAPEPSDQDEPDTKSDEGPIAEETKPSEPVAPNPKSIPSTQSAPKVRVDIDPTHMPKIKHTAAGYVVWDDVQKCALCAYRTAYGAERTAKHYKVSVNSIYRYFSYWGTDEQKKQAQYLQYHKGSDTDDANQTTIDTSETEVDAEQVVVDDPNVTDVHEGLTLAVKLISNLYRKRKIHSTMLHQYNSEEFYEMIEHSIRVSLIEHLGIRFNDKERAIVDSNTETLYAVNQAESFKFIQNLTTPAIARRINALNDTQIIMGAYHDTFPNDQPGISIQWIEAFKKELKTNMRSLIKGGIGYIVHLASENIVYYKGKTDKKFKK